MQIERPLQISRRAHPDDAAHGAVRTSPAETIASPRHDEKPRALGEIAADILRESFRKLPPDARDDVMAMAKLTRIDNDAEFELVSEVRKGLNCWRSSAARRIKPELETILSHYRADRWP